MPPHTNHNRIAKRLANASNSSGPSVSAHTFNVDELITPEEAPIESYVDRLSGNSRRIVREPIRVEPPSPVKRARLGEPTPAATDASPPQTSDNDADRYTMTPDDYGDDDDSPPGVIVLTLMQCGQ
ncbi:hypothetical protein B0H14DRAFT_2637199 [Mycena olivaceomarginata]|nr:hypothetical protein B0H14DRAFT_2637199 [Mycena olivaceomarginata]